MPVSSSLREVSTPLGSLWLGATEAGLSEVLWSNESVRAPGEQSGDGEHVDRFVAELELYVRGELREFTVPLDPWWTPFQLAVWGALREIPFGETRSYRDQARALGRPNAVRAVGAANGRNPLSIVVPCHRVIGADGKLTGYAGGLGIKRRLLELEGVLSPGLF